MLASLDGAIGPVAETRIPVTDEGLLRGDGGFEVARLYGGRPFAMEDHYARLQRTCNGLRLEFDLTALRAEVDALLEEAGPVEALLRIVLTRGGRRMAMIEPLPHRLGGRARDDRHLRAQPRAGRPQDALLRGQHARRAAWRKEQGYDEALFVTPHGRVLEGPTWTFFWVAGGRAAHAAAGGPHPRLDHARPRDRGDRRARRRSARSTTCAAPRRRSSPRACAR